MVRKDVFRAIRMYLHYDRTWEDSQSEEQLAEAEHRRMHYQRKVVEANPTDIEIEMGCSGREADMQVMGEMLDTIAYYQRKM